MRNSIFPFQTSESPGLSLIGPGGQSVETWAEKEMTLSFNGNSNVWIFMLSNMQFPILEIGFLRHRHLVNALIDS